MQIEEDKIVTIILHEDKIRWFISYNDYWILDRYKWKKDFIDNGYDLNNYGEVGDDRFNIAILDKENCEEFIKYLQQEGSEVTQQELANEFFSRIEITKNWWDFSELLPLLFVDFDNQIFYQEGLSESIDYKRYLPDSWKFHKDKHFENIPESLKFWVKDGIDYLKKIAAFINSNQH